MSGTIEFLETFEDGTAGAGITTTSTGFSTIYGSGTGTFDTTRAADGGVSAKVVSDGTGGNAFAFQRNYGANQNVVYLRFAGYLSALPGGNLYIASFGVASGTGPDMRVNPNGTLTARNNLSATATTTHSIVPGQWFVVEWNVNVTAQTQSLRLYLNSADTVPVETVNGTYNQGLLTYFKTGITTSQAATIWIDAVADAFDDWVGPLTAATQPSGMYRMSGGALLAIRSYEMRQNLLA